MEREEEDDLGSDGMKEEDGEDEVCCAVGRGVV